MVVTTSIVRPRLAGGRPATDQEKALIKRAEDLIRAHEENHREIARAHANIAVMAARGKPGAQVDGIINKIMKDLDASQAGMDHVEGMLIVDHNGPNGRNGPATGVRSGPAP